MPKRTITYTQDIIDTSEASVSNNNKRAKLSNDKKLSKFNISKTNYNSWSAELSKLRYSQDQIDKVILRKSSTNTVKSLIINHQLLINSGFNNANLISVSSHQGGSKNLEALISLVNNQLQWNNLTNSGFTVDNFVKIIGHGGGSKNLKALISLVNNQLQWNNLTNSGFTVDNFVKITSSDGGSKNLEALISLVSNQDQWNNLKNAGFTVDNFVKITSNNGGSKNLEALISLVQDQILCNNLTEAGFTVDNFVKITSNNGGSKKLNELVGRWELQEFVEYFNLVSDETLTDLEGHYSPQGDSEEPKRDTQAPDESADLVFQSENPIEDLEELRNHMNDLISENLLGATIEACT